MLNMIEDRIEELESRIIKCQAYIDELESGAFDNEVENVPATIQFQKGVQVAYQYEINWLRTGKDE